MAMVPDPGSRGNTPQHLRYLGVETYNGRPMEVYRDHRGQMYGRPLGLTTHRHGLRDGGTVVGQQHSARVDPNGKHLKATYVELSEGDHGISQTLKRMKKLALEGSRHPDVWRISRQLVGTKHPNGKAKVRDQVEEARRLLKYIQTNIRWTPDIGDAETLAAPHRTLEVGAGDCDDVSILLAAMATSLAIPNRLKAIAADSRFPQEYTHVYNELKLNGRWVAAEPSIEGKALGWESPEIYKVMLEDVWTLDE